MGTFNQRFKELLAQVASFVDNTGELLPDVICDRAWKLDHDLIKLLISNNETKKKFFDKVSNDWVFNHNTFVDYVRDKNFLDNSYTSFRNKIGLNIGGKFLRERNEVSLVWPYKDCVLEGGQTKDEQKRDELFFNEILAHDEINRLLDPKVLTNWKRHTANGIKKVQEIRRDEAGTIRENTLVKGNNLLALYSLVEQFRGKVKLIYIDPPYNTGKDSFGYNNRFNHSSWLTFMRNRLEIARELLRDNGLLCVSMSDNEAHYCKVLVDEVFSRDNFVADVIWNSTKSVTNTAVISDAHTHNLLYAKNILILKDNRNSFRLAAREDKFSNPDNDPRGKWIADPFQVGGVRPNQQYEIVNPVTGKIYKPNAGCSWKNHKKIYDKLLKDNRIVFGSSGEAGPQRKRFWAEAKERGLVTTTLWTDLPTTTHGTKHLRNLLTKSFGNPKPEGFIERFIKLSTDPGDIILDFFAGSGTTAAVAHKMNRQWIAVEQMDYIEKVTVERLSKVIAGEQGGISKSVNWQGGGDFLYCELMPYAQTYVDRIQRARSSRELDKLWQEISRSTFLNWYINNEDPTKARKTFIEINDPIKQKQLLMDLLDKNQLYVHYSEIDDKTFEVSEHDKKLNRLFYGD